MIRRLEDRSARAGLPWADADEVRRLAFACLWTTGPDPGGDAAFRLRALRRRDDGSWERFDRAVRPDVLDGSASARMAREFGVTGAELEDAQRIDEAFPDFLAFLGDAPVIVPDRAAFASWVARLSGTGEVPMRPLGLAECAALLAPGRLASDGERLAATLLRTEALEERPRALDPADLQAALGELVGRALARDEVVLSVLAHGYFDAWESLCGDDEVAADDLALVLRLLEHPSAWTGGGELFAGGGTPADGRLTAALEAHGDLALATDEARPLWGRTAREERRREPFPTTADDPVVLDEADRRTVDEILQEHLPRLFADDDGRAPSYREGQHAVAAEVARGFGRRELLLVHAPTGTGKTLAYLVPVMLWAFRNSVRVGVATFTRALQEQALDREVPLARELLRRAGVSGDLRVALLKGRNNYLCWRGLKLQAPRPMDSAVDKLAWTAAALFALTDADGDLDRLPRRPPLELDDADRWRRALARLLSLARAEPGCCALREDREDCAGDASRRRAERSHVVITNHAFALARREFFKQMVFDECEHLHGQAHSAFSHAVSFRELREALLRLHKPGGPARNPLNRIAGEVTPGSTAAASVEACINAQDEALASLDELQRAVYRFKLWRDEAVSRRDERDHHSLFREYVCNHDEGDLARPHAALAAALAGLAASLAGLAEELESLETKGLARIRRSLEVARTELAELIDGVEAWIPYDDEGPAFRRETFHDLETTPRGHDVMAARVLLPHEHLGRYYYPELHGAVLISATTWLRGGFDAASNYLGCARAAEPAEDEERDPVALRTFRAPEVFDYRRVLVAVPRDAPSLRQGKQAYLDYVARFVGFLGERTRGRILVLFTNADDCAKTAARVTGFFAERRIPFWHQRMEGANKEELSELFRAHTDSVLFGLDTFWYGADFPGETLEYLVIVRLPYGVPDRYHHAQCAALGASEQRRTIYMPRALAKFRQGFGRLMRKETDKGCVFVLDGRILEPRHRAFLKELPLRTLGFEEEDDAALEDRAGAALVRGDSDRCLREALAHMGMLADVKRRALDLSFGDWRAAEETGTYPEPPVKPEVPETDLPF